MSDSTDKTQVLEGKAGFDETFASMISSYGSFNKDYVFYAFLIAQCRICITDRVPTAGVNFTYDHYNLFINPEFFNPLPIEQRVGILKHEMMHILLGHIFRGSDYDHEIYNYAADCALNQQINRNHLPSGAIYPDTLPVMAQYQGKVPSNATAEQYYHMIEVPKDGNSSENQPGQGNGDHSLWDESQGDEIVQKELTKKMAEKAANETLKTCGTLPLEYSDWINLLSDTREVNWQRLLTRITGNKRIGMRRTFLRKNRRNPRAGWLKGRTKDRKFELLVISDVSGSVSTSALLQLWGEVRNICDITQSNVHLIQVDTSPSLPEELTKFTKTIERKACGGTLLHPAIDMASEHKLHYDALVITTDGYLNSTDVQKFEELNKRTIWLIEPNGEVMPEMNYGKMVAIKLTETKE